MYVCIISSNIIHSTEEKKRKSRPVYLHKIVNEEYHIIP